MSRTERTRAWSAAGTDFEKSEARHVFVIRPRTAEMGRCSPA